MSWWARLAVALTAAAVTVVLRPAAAQITLNLKDADIQTLVASIAEITGKNFVIDPRVKGQVSLVSAKPLSEDEIYQVFLSILATHGFAAIPGDQVVKIVPSAGAKQAPVPTVDGPPEGGEDQVVTQVIQVRNTSVEQLVPILRPLLPPEAHMAANPGTNVLVVSDVYANVRRIADIVRRIDTASDADVEVVRLRHAGAVDVARMLVTLEQGRQQVDAGAAANPVQVVSDERSNSVLISGTGGDRRRLKNLIAGIDTPLKSSGDTEVIYLRYAKAPALLEVLLGVSAKLDSQDGAAATAEAATANRAPKIDIQADEATNALIITANPDELRSLRSVIAQLDIRRAQVLVEAVIAEVNSDKVAELGVQWIADGSDSGNIVGLTNFGGASFNGISLAEVANSIINEQVPTVAPLGALTAVGDFSGSSRFGALISALASDADSNVLATPTLVTMDNEEAEIVVGQNLPFVTGSFTTDVQGSETVGNPFQTIERRDVGLTLRVTPQVNEGDAVQLDIIQELSSVVPSTATLALSQGPTTSKRAIRTNVLLQDGQVLVLGGLINDTLTETVQKVPGLGDIPLLGNLFRYRQTAKEKRNLMIFIHPVILRDADAGTAGTAGKYSYIREQQILARERGAGLLPEVSTPLLKPRQQVRTDGSFVQPVGSRPEPLEEPRPEEKPHSSLGGYRDR